MQDVIKAAGGSGVISSDRTDQKLGKGKNEDIRSMCSMGSGCLSLFKMIVSFWSYFSSCKQADPFISIHPERSRDPTDNCPKGLQKTQVAAKLQLFDLF
jgi:hypothetical protein